MLAAILMGRAVDRHRLCGENRGGKEQCVVVLAAVKAVADADPVWLAYRRDPDVATQASATYLLHGRSATAHSTEADFGMEKVKSYRSEEHTSELQSLMRISYAVFCLKKKQQQQ